MLLSPRIETYVIEGVHPTRQKLIVSASLLFQRRGYHGVGTAEILKHAGVPKGSLYHHFPDGKLDLACACASWVTGEIVRTIESLSGEGKNSEQIVAMLLSSIADWTQKTNFGDGSLLSALTTTTIDEESDKLAEHIRHSYQRICTAWENILRKDGVTPDKVINLSQTIVATIEGSIVLSRAIKDISPICNAKKFLLNSFNENC